MNPILQSTYGPGSNNAIGSGGNSGLKEKPLFNIRATPFNPDFNNQEGQMYNSSGGLGNTNGKGGEKIFSNNKNFANNEIPNNNKKNNNNPTNSNQNPNPNREGGNIGNGVQNNVFFYQYNENAPRNIMRQTPSGINTNNGEGVIGDDLPSPIGAMPSQVLLQRQAG